MLAMVDRMEGVMTGAEILAGPWTSADQQGSAGHCLTAQVFGPDGTSIAIIDGRSNAAIANQIARRMAAAPEMLAALKDILRIARAASMGSTGHNQQRIARAATVIAKAEGRSL